MEICSTLSSSHEGLRPVLTWLVHIASTSQTAILGRDNELGIPLDANRSFRGRANVDLAVKGHLFLAAIVVNGIIVLCCVPVSLTICARLS